jgi:subtilisin
MEATSRNQAAGVRSMSRMLALVILMTGVACAGHGRAAQRKIIIFGEDTTRQVHRQVVERHGLKVLHHLKLLNAVTTALPDDKVEMVLAALRKDRRVVDIQDDQAISADHVVSITPLPLPDREIVPWGVARIGVPIVSELIASNSVAAPKVAILDTGIDMNHPELVQQIDSGYNACAEENPDDYQDYNGHGTHIAGIIAAAWNGWGIKGIIGAVTDPTSVTEPRLVAVKVLDDTGHGYLSDLVHALQWVYDHRIEKDIKVVNISLSFSNGSPLLAQVTNQLYAAGVVMVASAGNRCVSHNGADEEGGDSGCDSPNAAVRYPAAYSKVIAVVATDMHNNLTDYSRSGSEVDLAAPGGDEVSGEILSLTVNDGYGIGTGTSQAAAHVSGAAAVALQLVPELSVQQVVDVLKGTAKDLGYSQPHQGAGLLAVDRMVKKLIGSL